MIEEVKKFILENNLISSENFTLFVAVSGGIDSCVLLDILYQLRKEFLFNLKISHFNHNTRGSENIKDEKFVDDLAKKYKLPIRIGRYNGSAQKKSEGFLREERYKFFETIIKRNKNALIATAHNSDDNVETFVMRLAKGSRLKGLLSIRPLRGKFIRPLLSQSRAQIELYAKKNNIEYREDLSNYDNTYTRNHLRNEIIPYLEKELSGNIKQNILKIIDDLFSHYSLYQEQLKIAIKRSVKVTKINLTLNRRTFQIYSPPIQRGLIDYCISYIQPLNYGISNRNFVLWNDFILNATPGKKKNIFEAGYALAERKEIIFGDFPEQNKETYTLMPESSVVIDNKFKILLSNIKKEDVNLVTNKNIEIIDGSKSGSKLFVRFWRKGDFFRPLGMNNKRKLSDFFIDLKLSTSRKKEIPIVCSENKIIWVAGYRLDDQFKISDTTKIFYKIELSEVKN